MFVILGAVFDEVAAMVITLPFVLPLIKSLGYDPVWWGIINVVVCELGMIVPPIGINVFVLHGLRPTSLCARSTPASRRSFSPTRCGSRCSWLSRASLWLPQALK